MPRTVPPFADLLAGCKSTALHLETRDVYGIPTEDADYAAWLGGASVDVTDRSKWWDTFHTTVSDAVARGVVVRRARVVSEPVSDYIRYEHACTQRNIEAGEDVRWLPRSQASDLLLPGNDYWIFDGQLVRFGLFAGDGRFVAHALEDAPHVVKQCSDAFQAVWDRATPHAAYEI
ncbi:hypothetical protein GT352_20135 [Streptomyces sp. SID1046]|nr:DUF6879 family protein [Streptomyces sp. SID1046]MYV76222.1 hypothetical protein [Streptomyces sp. SID1046]